MQEHLLKYEIYHTQTFNRVQSCRGRSPQPDPKNNESDWDTGDSVRGQRILFYSRGGLKSSIGISYLDWMHFVAWITNADLTFFLPWNTGTVDV